MTGYRLIPTFRLARRIAQDLHPFPMRSSMFSRHWKQMMDHHLGMMGRMLDHGEKSPWSRRRWLDEAFAPSWWDICENGHQSTSPSSPKREFGRVEFGQDVKKFELVVDLGEQAKPDDVRVNIKLVNNNELHVEAKHEIGSAETGEFRKQFFSKVVSLPTQTDVDALKSTISDEGMLKVEAPMMDIEEQIQTPVREIPIERGASSKNASSSEAAEMAEDKGK